MAADARAVVVIAGEDHAHRVLAMGLLFTAYSLMHDMHELGTVVTTWTPFLLLGVALLIALGFDPIGMDALQARTGLDTATLQVQLLDMELAGAVARLPGGLFQRMGRA